MNSKHIVLILKEMFFDKCGHATWYDHTYFGGLRLTLLVLILSPTSIGVLKCLFCVYFKHGIRLLWLGADIYYCGGWLGADIYYCGGWLGADWWLTSTTVEADWGLTSTTVVADWGHSAAPQKPEKIKSLGALVYCAAPLRPQWCH